MYCSGCGHAINANLNYCSRCGAETVNVTPQRDALAENLTSALGYIGGFGLVFFFVTLAVMIKKGVGETAMVGISLLYLGALVTICSMILKQTGALAGVSRVKSRAPELNTPPVLMPITTAQLYEPSASQPGASVTEHTTRTLEEVPVGRKL